MTYLGYFGALLGACYVALAQNQTGGSGDSASTTSSELNFGPVNFGGYNNYVYRDNTTAVQVVISDVSSPTEPTRFLLAFPDGNTGAMVYFVPTAGNNETSETAENSTLSQNSTGLGATLDLASLQSISGSNNQTGIQGDLSVSEDFEFGVTIIGSVRTVRDYVESGGTVFNSIFNWTLGDANASSVTLVRNWIIGTTTQYFTFDVVSNGNISVTPNANATLPPNISLIRPDQSTNMTLRFTHTFNWTTTTPETPFVPLVGLGREDLFLTDIPNNGTNTLGDVLLAIQANEEIANQVSWLSYTSESFAGGWRFLTYFGRDTLLALRLLLPVASQTSAEAILGAVLQRINETGTVCHEETVGDYASFIHIQNNQSELGNTPEYNYVMVDTDFLLLPVLADYFLTYPQGQGRAGDFLARNSTLNNGTFEELLIKNVDHVLNLSMPFGMNATQENLVQIRDPLVGNWRDSGSGLGYGIYPFDVNCALVPSALRAVVQLAEAGILSSNYTENATTWAEVWETEASRFFEVSIDATTATSRLDNYIIQANLTQALLYGAGALNDTQTMPMNGSTTGNASDTSALGWGAGDQIIGGGEGNSTFYALSIKREGGLVEVLNSDLGFVLLYANNVSANIIQATIEALQPYPRGLLTNVGMVVANAAYDSNTTNIEVFNNLQYHGAVSWSWQQGIMAAGVSKQLGLCGASNNTQLEQIIPGDAPSWCSNTTLVENLTSAQTRLWDSIQGSAPALYTEVLSPVFDSENNTFTIGDLGAISPTGTEGDAIQLWSYGFLAQVDPRTGRAVAAGFE